MENNITEKLNDLKRKDDEGRYVWSSRELCKILNYSGYQKFFQLVERSVSRAKECGYNEHELFNHKVEKVCIGSGAKRSQDNYLLTSIACRFITEYADYKKPEVKAARRYFCDDSDGENCNINRRNELSFEEKEKIKKRNKDYWEEKTKEASQVYINKMGMLAAGIRKKEELLKEFYRDDSYLGNPAPHHIIYKLGKPLISKDGKRAYEFLIEYDIYEPSTGIYYGCKGLTIEGDHDNNIQKFYEEWDKISSTVDVVLSNIFPDKQFGLRFKKTNNANNNTYWPFWITLYEEEDIVGVAARALNVIKDVYKDNADIEKDKNADLPVLGAKVAKSGMIDKEKIFADANEYKTETAFTLEAYNEFTEKLKGKITVEEFIERLKEQKMVGDEEKYYEKAWRLQRDITQTDFAIRVKKVLEKYGFERCPWNNVEKLILNVDGRSQRNQLRQSVRESGRHRTEGREKKNKK